MSCTWKVMVRKQPVLFAVASIDIDLWTLKKFQLEAAGCGNTLACLTLTRPPQLAVGMCSAAKASGRRIPNKKCGFTQWLGDVTLTNAAMPPILRNALLQAESVDVLLVHAAYDVHLEFYRALSRACATSEPKQMADTPTPCRKRPVETSPDKVAQSPKKLRTTSEKEMGSNGEQCDWCGMTPAQGEPELKVCKVCHYSCCEECSGHHTKGACYCVRYQPHRSTPRRSNGGRFALWRPGF